MWFHSFVTGAAMLTTSTLLASAQSSATVPAAKKAGAHRTDALYGPCRPPPLRLLGR